MKKTHGSLLLIMAVICGVMISSPAQSQSTESVAVAAGSSQEDSPDRPHGDVQNIGNRDVSGKIKGILPNYLSLEQEIALGQQMATELDRTVRLLKDPLVTEYIDSLGQNLARHSDAKIPIHFKVVDSDEVDVFAIPGGFIYVKKGLIVEAESEAELAGVMAHAIAHVCARHATRLESMKKYLQIATPPVSGGNPTTQADIQNSIGLGINLQALGMTREFEGEADQLGIQYLWNTGYDPNAFVSFLEKMQARDKSSPGRIEGFFRNHPSPANRIAHCLDEERALPEKDSYIATSTEFARVKAALLEHYAENSAPKGQDAGIPGPPMPPRQVKREPIRVGSNIQESRLIRRVEPVYPELAKRARVQGRILIVVTIDEEGNVSELRPVSGHPLMVEAALDAVRQWKYSPTLLNGEPVPVTATVTVRFSLAESGETAAPAGE